jgi:hypothetical protein
MKIRCTDSSGAPYLTQGKVYETVDPHPINCPQYCYAILDNGNVKAVYNKGRFDIVKNDTKPHRTIEVRCKNDEIAPDITRGKIYYAAILGPPDFKTDMYEIINDKGCRAYYDEEAFNRRFERITEENKPLDPQKPDWDSIADSMDSFLGWAEDVPDDPQEVRYAIVQSDEFSTFYRWVRISPVPGVPHLRSTCSWGGVNGIKLAQTNAISNKRETRARYGLKT